MKQDNVALIMVDVQHDFLPGGSLGVPEGDTIVEPLLQVANNFKVRVATRDYHPEHHSSFTSAGAVPGWPDHCIQGTHGSELEPRIENLATQIVDKATTVEVDAYSGFQGTGLAENLRAKGIDTVVVGGLATDYCIKNTVVDACQNGFRTLVLEDAIRAVNINPTDGANAIQAMREAGAVFTNSKEVVRLLETKEEVAL